MKEKRLCDFHFRDELTPTDDVRDFIYAVMRRVVEIRDDLNHTIMDYINRDDEDQMRFGLSVAHTELELDGFSRLLELIHNCVRSTKEGGSK